MANEDTAKPPEKITRVVIRCKRDAAKPGGRRAELVVEPGGKVREFHDEDHRDKLSHRTHGVFAEMQCPSLQTYSLLIWLATRETSRSRLDLQEVKRLRGWEGVTTERGIPTALKRIIGDSKVLGCTNDRAWIQEGVQVVFEPEAERDEILRWADISGAPAGEAPPPPKPPGASEDPRFARYLAKLEADITAQLRRMPQITLALASELRLSVTEGDSAPRIARALLHEKTGRETVMALNVVDEDMRDDATRLGDRRILRRILLQALPVASDWRPWVQKGRSALASGEKFVDLPLSNLTMAEAILAGMDCRPCRYETEGPIGPLGPAIIRLPAADGAFMDRLAEATVGLLAVQLLGLSPDAAELRDHVRIQRRVNEALQFYTEVTGDKYLPRWLLVDDELLGHVGKRAEGKQDHRVAAAVAVLSKELPFLRILRLGDGVEGETNLALHIDAMWRKHIGGE